MNFRSMILAAALVLPAGAAMAQAGTAQRPERVTGCILPSGELRPPVCKSPPSRLDLREDICICHEGVSVQASACPAGTKEPPDSVETWRARKDYLKSHRDLVGATWQGGPLCIAPRGSGR